VLSSIYLASCVLKHFEDQGRRATDLPLVEWSVRTLMYQAQEALHSFLRNLPNRWAARFLRMFIFPRGRTYSAPSDDLVHKVVELVTTPGEARERLSEQAYTTIEPGNPVGLLEEALRLSIELAPFERRLRQAHKEGLIRSEYLGRQIDEAATAEVIDKDEAAKLRDYHEKVFALLAVDDFAPEDLRRTAGKQTQQAAPKPAKKAAKRKQAPRQKVARKKKVSRKKKSAAE
jgi:acyl-CoA dehydrogenase